MNRLNFRNPLTYLIILGIFLLSNHPWAFFVMMVVIFIAWELTMNKENNRW